MSFWLLYRESPAMEWIGIYSSWEIAHAPAEKMDPEAPLVWRTQEWNNDSWYSGMWRLIPVEVDCV